MSVNQTNPVKKPFQFSKVLCQNCLRVLDYTYERHVGEELCQCGGDFCGCENCVETINALLAGKRKAEDIGCSEDVGEWNQEDGFVMSVNQTNSSENVPQWWEFFVARFVEFGELKDTNEVMQHSRFLGSYILGLNHADVISGHHAENIHELLAETTMYFCTKIINEEVNQTNQHESLTDFEDLPFWYRAFWGRLDKLSSSAIDERWTYGLGASLKSYLLGIYFVDGISVETFNNLEMLVDEAVKFAESNLIKEAA